MGQSPRTCPQGQSPGTVPQTYHQREAPPAFPAFPFRAACASSRLLCACVPGLPRYIRPNRESSKGYVRCQVHRQENHMRTRLQPVPRAYHPTRKPFQSLGQKNHLCCRSPPRHVQCSTTKERPKGHRLHRREDPAFRQGPASLYYLLLRFQTCTMFHHLPRVTPPRADPTAEDSAPCFRSLAKHALRR